MPTRQPDTDAATVTSSDPRRPDQSSTDTRRGQEVPQTTGRTGAPDGPGTPNGSLHTDQGTSKTSQPSQDTGGLKPVRFVSLQKHLDEQHAKQVYLKKRIADQQRTINKLRCKSSRQSRKIRELHTIAENPKITKKHVLNFMKRRLPRTIYDFFKLQLDAASKEANGRRYSDEEIVNSLALYRESRQAYNMLRARFFLPCPRHLRKAEEKGTRIETIILPF